MANFLTRLFAKPEPYMVSRGRVTLTGDADDETLRMLRAVSAEATDDGRALAAAHVILDPLDHATGSRASIHFTPDTGLTKEMLTAVAEALDQALTAHDTPNGPRERVGRMPRATYPLAVIEDGDRPSGHVTPDGRTLLRLPGSMLTEAQRTIIAHEVSHVGAKWRRMKSDPTHDEDGGRGSTDSAAAREMRARFVPR